MSSTYYIGNDPTEDPNKIGQLVPVHGNFNTTGTNYLKADGSDITASSYPAISGSLNAATASTLRQLPSNVNFNTIGYGNGLWIACARVGSSQNYSGYSTSAYLFCYSTDGILWSTKYISLDQLFDTASGSALTYYYPTQIKYLNGNWYLTMSPNDPGYNPPATGSSNMYAGAILRSTDGYRWATVKTNPYLSYIGVGPYTYMRLNALRYLNGVYFAIAGAVNSGGAASFYPQYEFSSNGTSWTSQAVVPADGAMTDIAYGAGVYVMVSGYPTCTTCSSSDNITYTQRTNSCTYGWTSIAYGAGCFVTVQGHYNGASTVAGYSTDGITWSSKTIPSGRYMKVLYANSKFVAIGYGVCATSTDGQTWTARTVPNLNWYDMDYSATNGFIAVANNYNSTTPTITIQSSDGITWTSNPINTGINCGNVIYNTTDGFVTIDRNTNNLLYSSDGLSWSKATTQATSGHHIIASNPSGSIYCSSYHGSGNAIYRTTNAISGTWTQARAAYSGSHYVSVLKWVNDRFICAGWTSNSTSYPYGYVMSSMDGSVNTWITHGSDTASSTYLHGVCPIDFAYGNGYYVGVGNLVTYDLNNSLKVFEGKMSLVSSDGMYYETTTGLPFVGVWSCVEFGNGVFVALTARKPAVRGLQGTVDADSFQTVTSGVADAAGTSGRMGAVSTNGSDWVPMYMPMAADWQSLSFNGHVFIAIASNVAKYAVSKDGFNWTLRDSAEISNWESIASNTSTNTSVVVSGQNLRISWNVSEYSQWFNNVGATMRITESATAVTLPYVKPNDGINYIVRVK